MPVFISHSVGLIKPRLMFACIYIYSVFFFLQMCLFSLGVLVELKEQGNYFSHVFSFRSA